MRFLLAEDETRIASFVKRGLEEEGYGVDVVADGHDAFAYASSGSYDALILDIMMPKLDGLTVCRNLREQGCSLPILMLTARDTVDDKVGGFTSGADDYLVKPFAFEELVARLRALLRRSHTIKPVVLRVADVALDPSSRTVTRAGKTLQLTNREYQLLQFLMQREGIVQSRATILNRVWGYDFEGETNVVEAYVRLLRRKVDAGHLYPLLHTVRGAGYVLRSSSKTR